MDWGLTSLQNPYAGSGTIRTRRSIDNVAASDPQGAADLQAQQMQQANAVPPAAPEVVNPSQVTARDTMKNLMLFLADKVKGGDVRAIDAAMADLNKAAASGPSPLALQADNYATQAKAATSLADWMAQNPQAAPQLQTVQSVPGLSLPGVPDNVQPTANPIASLGAGIAGLFAPRAAGAFGAAALQGAITASDKLNAAKRQQYQFDLQQSLLKHEDDVRRADAQARIDAQNAAVKNAYSAEQHADNLKQAVQRADASQLTGQAGNLKAFIEGSGPADAAKAKLAQLEQARKEATQEQIQAYKTLADVSSSVSQADIEDRRLAQSAAQFQQGQQAKQAQLTQEMQRYEADRNSREKIANQRAALDLKLGNMTDATARYRIATDHNDRVSRLIQEDKNSGNVMKDPKTYETMAAQQTMEAAQQRLKDAQQQLNAPSMNNPNYNPAKASDPAYTHARQKEVDYAQKQFEIARDEFLKAGAEARKVQAKQTGSGTGLPGVTKTYRFNPATGQVEEVK